MTEGLENGVGSTPSIESVPTVSVAVPQPVQEKMVPQSKVNELVGHAKTEAYEKARREMYEQKQVQINAQPAASSMGGMLQLTPEQLKQEIANATQAEIQKIQQQIMQQQQQEAADQLVQEFSNKLTAGPGKYSDFDQKVYALDLRRFPALVPLSLKADNTADVMYELANNPTKAELLHSLALRHPVLAEQEIQKMSASIKANQTALEQKHPNEPLSQINQSLTATDNGSKSVSDLRKQSWLKA